MRLAITPRDQSFVLEVHGEVDLSNAEQLRAAAHRLTGHAGPLVIDLTDLAFIDSSGIHALVSAQANAIEANIPLTLTPPRGQALRAFEIAGLADQLFMLRRADRNVASAQPTPGVA